MLDASTVLLRGSGYVTFTDGLPEQPTHAAIASTYSHVTAPLRRLVDRYAGEVCVALSAGEPVSDWVLAELEALPTTMRESTRRANAYERAVLDLVEAAVLRDRVGEDFAAMLVDVDDRKVPYFLATTAYTCVFNLTGHPVVVVPLAKTKDGMPIGVQIVGRRWSEPALLALAQKVALITGPFRAPPGY